MTSARCFVQTILLCFLSNLLLSHQTYRNPSLRVLFKWKIPEFNYPSDEAKYEAIQRGEYIPTNVPILASDYYAPTKRYFVTSPGLLKGIPATLSEVVGSPAVLQPFPRWPDKRSCRDPSSVFRVHIDQCGLMWVLDSGRSNTLFENTFICPPKLVVYDLSYYDREVLRYEFPKGVATDRSLLHNIITEAYTEDCSDSIAYITDVSDYGLIVFDFAKKASWRIKNKFFLPYPIESTITSNNVTFDLTDGVTGLALSPSTDSERKLYFHSFASVKESWAPVNLLKDETLTQNGDVARALFAVSRGEREGQSTVQVMTDDGVLIYALITRNAIACWNSATPFTLENQHILLENNEVLQFVTGLKLIGDDKLLITSSRLQNFVIGKVDETTFNYRVMVADDLKRLLRHAGCSYNSVEEDYPQYRSFFPSTPNPWYRLYNLNSAIIDEYRIRARDTQQPPPLVTVHRVS